MKERILLNRKILRRHYAEFILLTGNEKLATGSTIRCAIFGLGMNSEQVKKEIRIGSARISKAASVIREGRQGRAW